MDIIPAIDIIDGKCVRLTQGDYSQIKEYSSSPLEMARIFESWGLKRLHLVDLDGAKEKKIINYKILSDITSGTNLIVDFGGGIRTENDICIAFENGASMITIGSIAVNDPQLFLKWLQDYGKEKIILGADHRNEMLSSNAWVENTRLNLFQFLGEYINLGITQVICTDIEKDGMLNGPSVDLYRRILNQWPDLHLVASGGVGSIMDIKVLSRIGISATIIGKAIYENRITKQDLMPYLI
jgi:phosphoribosylformimino-5-aminoimidazole carboxamide ribotide isomerase